MAHGLCQSTGLGNCAGRGQFSIVVVVTQGGSNLLHHEGSVLVPMMLMSLGARLASSQIADACVGVQSSFLIFIVRLVAVFMVLWFIPLQGLERRALILFACLPPAVFNFMLADKFQVEPTKVASTVIVGHLLSLAFLPLGIWLAFI